MKIKLKKVLPNTIALKLLILLVSLNWFVLTTNKISAQVPRLPDSANFYRYIESFYNSDAYNPLEELEGGRKAEHDRLMKQWGARLYPHGDFSVANKAIINYSRYFQPIRSVNVNPNWVCIGPDSPINSSRRGVGQIHRITYDPNYGLGSNRTVYISSGYGGLWRSVNDGDNWVNVNTDNLPLASVADIAINPNNSNHLFIGSGLPDGGIQVQYCSNWGYTNPIFTTGMYRSLDNGTSWTEINNGFIEEFYNKGGVIRKLEINPTDGNIILAATSNGIFRCNNALSTDSLLPPFWSKVFDGVSSHDNDFRCVKYKPNSSNILYGSSTDIFKSTDNGTTWSSMTGAGTGLDSTTLLPYEPFRINLAVTPANDQRLFAFIFALSGNDEKIFIYYHDGLIWKKLYSGQSNGYTDPHWMALAVSPTNADEYYFYGTDGVFGTHNLSTPIQYSYYTAPGVYADGHVLEFQPNIPMPKLFYGHHAGVSLGNMSAPHQWIFKNQGLQNMLIWSFDDSEFDKNIITTANQDCYAYIKRNGSWNVIADINSDSYVAKSSRVNPNLFFFSGGNHDLRNYNYENKNVVQESGKRPFDFRKPSEVALIPKTMALKSPPNENFDFFGLTEIYKRKLDFPTSTTTNSDLWEGDSDIGKIITEPWQRQITEFDFSLNNPDTIYLATGATLYHGGLYEKSMLARTTVGGTNGNYNIDSYFELSYPGINNIEFPAISGIAVHPYDAQTLWITMVGYDNIEIRVAKSTDGGTTWENADPSQSLPELPINGIVYQNGSNDLLYLATDVGIYFKDNSMSDWEKYGDFPNVRVHELKINYCDNKLRAATYGRGIWEGDILLHANKESYYEVKNNVTVTWDKPRALKSSIRIKSGGTLIIKDAINMPIDSKIIVEQGGKLYIDGGTLSNSCGNTWQGIEVWGDSREHQWPDANGNYSQGYVSIKNAVIKNAICALNLMKPGDFSKTGGIVYASNTSFVNNTMSLHATFYANFHPINGNEMDYQANFRYCTFELNSEYAAAPKFFKHVDISSIRGVKFDACNFVLTPDAPNVDDNNHGIASYSANFSVNGVCNSQYYPCPDSAYDRSTFTGFYNGISANLITDAYVGFYVNLADFHNNTYGIFVNGINNYRVLRSNFHIGRHKCDNIFCSATPGFGIYSSDAYGFSIEENLFEKAENVISAYYVGVYIGNSNNVDVIYKNTFKGLSYGNYANLENVFNSNPNEGLTYICNKNTNNYADFFSPEFSAIQYFQGDRTVAAGNSFSNDATWHFFNDGKFDITYYYCPNCIHEVPDTAKLNRVTRISSVANTCPSNLSGDIKLSMEQQAAFEAEFTEAANSYNGINTLYYELEDDGSTDLKLTDINTATSSNMLIVKDDLINTSPHLSEFVLKAVSDNTDVFPDAAIFDILAANPEELKKEKLIKHLQEKQDPLPQYLIDILKQVSEGSSYKTVLQQDMSLHGRKKANAAMSLIHNFLNDSIIDYNEIRNWFSNLGSIEADLQIIETYMHQKNYQAANSFANAIPNTYSLTGNDLEEFDMYRDLLILHQNLDSTRTYYELTDTEFAILQSVADSSKGKAGAKAKGIISKYYGGHFYDCIILDENSYKSATVNPNRLGELYGLNVACNPNPAREWTAIDYTLPANQNTAILSIFDNTGKLTLNKELHGQKGQFIWDTGKVVAGNYVYSLQCAGFTKSGKVTVVK